MTSLFGPVLIHYGAKLTLRLYNAIHNATVLVVAVFVDVVVVVLNAKKLW